jgi:DNA end-binding protein Ku
MTARALWKAQLVVGRKRVGVALVGAIQEHTVRLHLLHGHGRHPVRVRQRLVDPRSGDAVAYEEAQRGVEVEPGRFVVIDPAELQALAPKPSRDIAVEAFVPRDGIDHRWFARPYWLAPERGHADDYFALAAALERTGRDGFARWTMRQREYAGALRAHDGYLALVALRHAGEVVVASDLDAPGGRDFDARERELARKLVDALSGPFEHERFHDEYRERLLELVAQKKKGKRITARAWHAKKVADDGLAKALERSLKSAG